MKIKKTKSNLSKLQLIKILNKLRPEERELIIYFLDEKGIDVLCEAVTNVFFNDLKANKKRKNILYERFKNKQKSISKISDRRLPYKSRKKLLVQEGGSLGLILTTALPFLVNLLFSK